MAHHGGVEVNRAREALGDDALVVVDVALVAGDGVAGDQVREGERGLAAAVPDGVPGDAGLCGFGRVDAVEADAGAVDANRVAVGDRGGSGDLGMGWGGGNEEQEDGGEADHGVSP